MISEGEILMKRAMVQGTPSTSHLPPARCECLSLRLAAVHRTPRT